MRSALIGRSALLAMLALPVAAMAQQPGVGSPQSYGQGSGAGSGGVRKAVQDKRRTDEQRRLREQDEQTRRQLEEVSRWREMLR